MFKSPGQQLSGGSAVKRKCGEQENLSSTILAALAKLDQKGTDDKITRAMAIVFEAFRLNAAKRTFSSEDLFASAIYR